MVNKFYYIKGGSETYYFSLKKLLQSYGHTVIDFSMQDKKNYNSEYSSFFVNHVDYNSTSTNIIKKIKAAVNIVYSFEAKRKFEAIVRETEPDIIHLHIFQHQISPSILDIIKKYDIPVVYTAHDLKMVCLNYKMMHHGKICEDCKGEHYYKCIKNRCVKESFVKSMINVFEGYFHKFRKSYDIIDYIITPSAFYKKKMIEFGVKDVRLVHIPNFLEDEEIIVNELKDREKYYLYFGRLSEEKGIMTLIRAFEKISNHLKIVGTGPLYQSLQNYIQKNQISNIDLLGFKTGQELIDIVGNAKAIIIPSEWYENGPYSAIESLRLARPIIGADIGGIPELIDKNGILFNSGDKDSLSDAIKKMESLSEEKYKQYKQNSKRLYDMYYTSTYHYQKLKKVYVKAMTKHSRRVEL